MGQRSRTESSENAPTRNKMAEWLKGNLLTLVILLMSALGTYNLAMSRIIVLETIISKQQDSKEELRVEVKELQRCSLEVQLDAAKQNAMFSSAIEEQTRRARKSDEVIENNTKAFNQISLLIERVDSKLDAVMDRVDRLEDNENPK